MSMPVVGVMLTMINDLWPTLGKKPIGFINPTVCPTGQLNGGIMIDIHNMLW
jgi:hypothetical protein